MQQLLILMVAIKVWHNCHKFKNQVANVASQPYLVKIQLKGFPYNPTSIRKSSYTRDRASLWWATPGFPQFPCRKNIFLDRATSGKDRRPKP